MSETRTFKFCNYIIEREIIQKCDLFESNKIDSTEKDTKLLVWIKKNLEIIFTIKCVSNSLILSWKTFPRLGEQLFIAEVGSKTFSVFKPIITSGEDTTLSLAIDKKESLICRVLTKDRKLVYEEHIVIQRIIYSLKVTHNDFNQNQIKPINCFPLETLSFNSFIIIPREPFKPFVIGRKRSKLSGLQIKDNTISSRHCSIIYMDKYMVVDEGSTNYTVLGKDDSFTGDSRELEHLSIITIPGKGITRNVRIQFFI